MKILLYRPDSGIYTVLPPIGLMALSSYIRSNSPHEAYIYDGREACADDDMLRRKIEEIRPNVVGISTLTMERLEGHHAANVIKERFPDITVVMGGAYVTSDLEDALQNRSIDYCVADEGEIPIVNLLNAMQDNRQVDGFKGLAYKRDGEIIFHGQEDFIDDLNELPQIAWDLIDLERYFYNKKRPTPMNLHVKRTRSAPILTTRGCPYRCTYCHNLFGKKLRQRSVEHVMEEVRYLKHEKGVEEIEIIDDVFNLDLERAKEFCRKVIDEKLNLCFSFPNGLRADRAPDELIDLMIAMGTYRIVFAVESGSPQIQKEMKKNLNLEKARHAIDYTASEGISVGAFFILGFLNETEEQARMTIDFACSSKLSTASFFILTPFPNTEIFRQAQEAGYQIADTSLTHYYALGSNISKIPDDKLHKLVNYAYRRFYLHPARILRFFRTTPWHRFFFRKVFIILLFFFKKFKAETKTSLEMVEKSKWKRSRYS
ncbi:MAG: radical SAM protein [FCB group bacterium]|nr:radical SAM protein [FCB group bacterium]